MAVVGIEKMPPDRLLIIDDDKDIGGILTEIAQEHGFDALYVDNFDAMRACVVAWSPTAIITDLQMPKVDGVVVIRYLAREKCQARLAIISGLDVRIAEVAETVARDRGLNIVGRIQKPFDVSALGDFLERLRGPSRINFETLSRALSQDQINVHFQPKCSTTDGAIIGTEALIRWDHPQWGAVPPEQLVAFAEKHGMADALLDHVMVRSLKALDLWTKGGAALPLAINITPANLENLCLPDRIGYANASARGMLSAALTAGPTGETFAIHDIVTVPDLERWSNAMALATGGQASDFEIGLIRAGGTTTFAVSFSPLPEGECLLVLRDISQIRDIERARGREAEATARLMSNLPGAVFRIVRTPTGSGLSFQNQAIEDLTGYSRAELQELFAKPGFTLVHPDDLPARDAAVIDAIDRGRNFQLSWRLIHRDGSARWALERSTPHRTPDGAIEIEGLLVDITAQMETERMLRRQREQYAEVVAALDQSSDAVAIMGRNQGISYCNPAFAAMVNISGPAAAIGKATFHFFVADDPSFSHAKMQRTLNELGVYAFQHRARLHDGTRKAFACNVTQLSNGQQIVLMRDVTAEAANRARKDRMSMATARLGQSAEIAAGAREEAFRLLCREARAELSTDRVGLWGIDRAADVLRCEMLMAGDAEPIRFDAALPMAEIVPFLDALQGTGTVAANDVLTHDATKCFAEKYLAPIGLISKLSMPIYDGGQIVGVFCAESTSEARIWTDDEIMFARVVCDVAAHAVEASDRLAAQQQLAAMTADMTEITRALDLAHERIVVENAGGGRSHSSIHPLRMPSPRATPLP